MNVQLITNLYRDNGRSGLVISKALAHALNFALALVAFAWVFISVTCAMRIGNDPFGSVLFAIISAVGLIGLLAPVSMRLWLPIS